MVNLRKILFLSWIIFALAQSNCASISKREPAATTVDVIIVGAGMAGLTAAKELTKAQKTFVVLEAQDRIGGRALVSHEFSKPIDLGAAWFHGVDKNPLVPIADQMGFTRVDTDLEGPIYVGNRKATLKEIRACEKTSKKLDAALAQAHASGDDKAVSQLVPKAPCADVVDSNVGRLENGAETEKVSSITAGLFDSGNDDFVREGIGTFVAAYGKDVPVRLNEIVTAIDYSDSGVVVSLASGERVLGRRVLVTVSNGVLSAKKITFNPPLPDWKNDAIKRLPMGLMNKVVMQFKSDIFKDTPKNSWVMWDGPADDNIAFVIRPLDAPIAVAFYGGEQAKKFENDDAAALAHAKEALRSMFGDAVDKEFDRSQITKWGQNPWTLGAFSYVTPNSSTMHVVMQKPVNERVFFAGEACARPEFNGALHGAYESAVESSKMIIDSLAVTKSLPN